MTDRDSGFVFPQRAFNRHLPSFLATTCLAFHLLTKVFASILVRDHLPFPGRNHLLSPGRNHLPLGSLPTRGWRRPAALPLLLRGNLPTQGDLNTTGPLLEHFDVLHECVIQIPRAGHDDAKERKQAIMVSKTTNNSPHAANAEQSKGAGRRTPKKGSRVTEARAQAQRAKLDAQAQIHHQRGKQEAVAGQTQHKQAVRQEMQAKRRVISVLIEAYIQDHIGGNSSEKTLEWHRTALGLLRLFFEEELDILLIDDVDADDISAWFAHLRSTPAARGKVRSERTIQTYARSARAFFHWLIRRQTIERNPFERVVFPKVGRPLIQTITYEEFEQLLLACAPPNETGPLAERAAVRNRAILWLLYDTGIRVSELINLRVGDVDRKHGIVTVLGKGAKERRVALGQNCLRNLSYYLDKHRPNEGELAEWGSAGEDHLFLSETRQPLTKNGMEMLFKRLKKRAGIQGKRVSPHIFRHTFAMNYLIKSNDPFSLQELLGHEDLTTVLNYIHMNDTVLQEQKRKYSPGDHIPARMPGPREIRRKGFHEKGQQRKS
jgi:integrase/recombinase XerD